jgi:diguanylate cyclase (GGDEF)-like protein
VPAVLHRRRFFLVASLVAYVALVFWAFAAFEVPGLGIGHFFYVPVVLLALATGPRWGALAGLCAAGLYAAGIGLNPRLSPSEEWLSAQMGIRVATFTAMGALIGWFANSNRELLGRLREHAEQDFLTGLLNARAFEEALSRRLAGRRSFALVLVDVDDLKSVNDSEGHAAGNEYLQLVSETLRRESPDSAYVARIGGDEFALLANTASEKAALAECRRLQRELQARGLSASFGWATFPEDAGDALTLFHVADKRLYEGKVAGVERRGGRPHLRSVS